MENVLSYLKFRKDLSFFQKPMQEIDILAFSVISYLDYTDVINGCESLNSAAKKYFEKRAKEDPNAILTEKEKCLQEMASSKRYRKVKVENYMREISEEEVRTSYGITFRLSPFRSIVAFPGTDTSLLSWKENFMYMYQVPAPGQTRCAEYLEQALHKSFTKAIVVGHSKGGLLAAYAAMHVSPKRQQKISRVYLFDAPGFVYEIENMPEYKRIKDRIQTYVPVDSVVGRLFKTRYPNERIVNSAGEHFDQHELVNWSVNAESFDFATENSAFSEENSKIFNDLMDSVAPEKRPIVIDEMFDAFLSNGITNINDINHLKISSAMKVLLKYPTLSSETRDVLKTIIRELHK